MSAPDLPAWLGRLDEATARLRRLADDETVPEGLRDACETALELFASAASRALPEIELADHLTI
jgi:hypothetical protein